MSSAMFFTNTFLTSPFSALLRIEGMIAAFVKAILLATTDCLDPNRVAGADII